MELEEIIKPYSLAPDNGKRPGSEGAGGSSKRHHTDNGHAAADATSGGGQDGKLLVENLPDEIDASVVEKILEQADEVCRCARLWESTGAALTQFLCRTPIRQALPSSCLCRNDARTSLYPIFRQISAQC